MIIQSFLNRAGLISLPFTGGLLTWCNNYTVDTRIYERLDRVVSNSACFTMFPYFSLNNFPIHDSNHWPVCTILNPRVQRRKKTFKLEAMWLTHPNLPMLVNKLGLDYSKYWYCFTEFYVKDLSLSSFSKKLELRSMVIYSKEWDLHMQLQSLQFRYITQPITLLTLYLNNLLRLSYTSSFKKKFCGHNEVEISVLLWVIRIISSFKNSL